jgi:ABC-type multidrug transport system fused ATPase/permease subunit
MLNTPARESLAHSATIYIPPGARAAGGAPEWGEHALHASAHHGAILPTGPRLGQLVIEAKDLKKGFEGRTLIDGLTFELPPGGIVGVVGPNGASDCV